MTTAVGDPERVVEDELDAEYAGVGWWGTLYRAPGRRRWYRLIPVEEVSGEQRAELLAWQTRPRRPDLVPVVREERGEQRQFGDRWFQIVSYETDAGRSLGDVLDDPEPAYRLACVAAALRAFPGWRDGVGPGLVPLPADVVLAGHRPLLLPLPAWGPPSLGELFAAPERLAHLTPEAARGLPPGGRDPGVHALAVAALRCFESLPHGGDPERLMQRTACAGVFGGRRADGRLPVWMRRVRQISAAHEELATVTGPHGTRPKATQPDHPTGTHATAQRHLDGLDAPRDTRPGETDPSRHANPHATARKESADLHGPRSTRPGEADPARHADAHHTARKERGRLDDPRGTGPGEADPARLADVLDAARHSMDPVATVGSLREAGEPHRALGLAHAALVDRPGYDLLLLAAAIARQDLREPLEALSLLERAVLADPERVEAYEEQLSIVGGLSSAGRVRLSGAGEGSADSFAERLRATATAAFDRLPAGRRRDHAHEMASCLIGLGKLTAANAFVHEWLHDGPTLMWWRFDLMIDYAETFLGLGHLDAAGQISEQVRAGLKKVRENGQMARDEIHRHGLRLADFDLALLAARDGETHT
ncbi:hypothetical protein [Streptomyces cylindrosporus]|uniref:Tetratricopeptide repeat protein n=1 Tax=Streptomyces cylindrosporus TaxID=2927583 RepID=A0ABS9Y6J3_9ACTN|nr:hypothetical protein [Streptomyces cylindrosporus]MCI3272840.1 hypothetical protein [Streptomyces cylindrosporus]